VNDLGCIQRSPEWFNNRLGMVTSSKVGAIRQKKRGSGELAERRNLRFQIVAEILRSETTEHYVSPAMEWGIENEGRAKAEYEFRSGSDVEPVGLLMHPTMPRAAASPDGFIAPDGLLEIKCPETHTHLKYLDGGIVPHEYRPQMYWQMSCAGPEITWVDFVSYDPRVPEEFQMFTARLERDDEIIAEMEKEVEQFIIEVNTMALRLQQYASGTLKTLERSIRWAKSGKPKHNLADILALQDEVVP
jgi:putative phage-type endonuclease